MIRTARLHGSGSGLEIVLEGIEEGVLALDYESRVTYLNPAAGRMLGRGQEELVGQSLRDECPETFSPSFCRGCRRAIGERVEVELAERCQGLAERVQAKIIPSAEGAVVRLRADTGLTEEARSRLAALVESAGDAIIGTDLEGNVTNWNRGAAGLFGYSAAEMLDRSVYILSAPEHFDQARSVIARLAGGEPPVSYESVNLARGGRRIEVSITASPVLSPSGAVSGTSAIARDISELRETEERLFTGIIRDVSERKSLESQLRHQAFHDTLTNLPNRALFMDRLSQALLRGGREEGSVAVLSLDLDRFKLINDSFGPVAGDALLADVGKRLRASVPPEHTVARMGGDEFAVLIEDAGDVTEAIRTAENLAGGLGLPFKIEGSWQSVSVSIGAAFGGPEHKSATDLLRNSDIAMYRAKHGGRGGYTLYEPAMGIEAVRRLEIENGLREAIEREEFRLYYQPKVDLPSGRVVGMEALLRWEHPTHGLTPPDQFVPVAEESGLIVPIGRWALREACRQARAWHDLYPDDAPAVCVNLSPRQLRRYDLAEEVSLALAEAGLDPACLVLELTENAFTDESEPVADILRELKALGVMLSIDDFGTGYSNLGRLEELPLDLLKIDRSFIGKLEGGPTETAIVEAVVGLAHGLGMEAVAEGIETAEQLIQVRSLGCEMGQGYYFSRPVPAAETYGLLAGRFAGV